MEDMEVEYCEDSVKERNEQGVKRTWQSINEEATRDRSVRKNLNLF